MTDLRRDVKGLARDVSALSERTGRLEAGQQAILERVTGLESGQQALARDVSALSERTARIEGAVLGPWRPEEADKV